MAKRLNGEGTIRRRPTCWELRVMNGYRADGKPSFRYFYGKTKKEVQEKLDEFKADLHNGLDTKHPYTFEEWAGIWFEHHRPNIAPTTQENYRFLLKRISLYLAKRKIMDIKPFDIEDLLQCERESGYSDSHLSGCRGLLYMIFNKAEANDLIRKNPVRYADKMRSSGKKKRKEAFTAEEVKLLMEKLPKDKFGMSIRLLLGTGMRSQELLALEPRHIEEDGSVIHIRQAINMVKGTAHVGVPKSRDSYRDIPVPESIRWCAVELRNVDTKFIFEKGRKDLPCNPSYYRDHFRKTLATVEGVRLLTPHSCRHTYVSQLQALGVDLATIQSIVGHADIDMTQHYLHVQKNIRLQAVQKFSDAFSPEEPDPKTPDQATGKVVPFPRVG